MPFDAERLKQMRERRGMTQRELSTLCGVSITQLSRYENKTMDPSLPNLEVISLHLRVSIDYLMDRTDDPDKHYENNTLNGSEQAMLDTYRREGWAGVVHMGVEKLTER